MTENRSELDRDYPQINNAELDDSCEVKLDDLRYTSVARELLDIINL